MSYATKLKYAGEEPYQPEAHRVAADDDAMTYEEYELLTQDDTYQKLAEVRWLASGLELEFASPDAVPQETYDALFDAACLDDSSLKVAVETYVESWLAEYRSDDEEEAR